VFTDTLYSKASIDPMGIDAATLSGVSAAGFALLAHNHSGTYANSTHTHVEYEPLISKATAFNKPFGSTVNTVCDGDDSRLSDNRTPHAHTHNKVDIVDLSATQTYVTSTQPTGLKGELWFATNTHELQVHDGSAWQKQQTNDGYF